MKTLRRILPIVAAIWACGGSTDPLKSGVQVSFMTRSPSLVPGAPAVRAATALAPSGDTLRDGTNTLVLTKAEMILEKIELERSGAACVSDCAGVETGPVFIDLPTDPGALPRFNVDLPTGSYGKLKFEVHKLGNDAVDQALRQAHPELIGKSIRVTGLYNDQAFTFLSELDVGQELLLSPPLMVTPGASTNLTIRVFLGDWFRDGSGRLVDPASANKDGPNESLVSNNIQRSMKAFEDRDGDGDERDG